MCTKIDCPKGAFQQRSVVQMTTYGKLLHDVQVTQAHSVCVINP